MFELSARREGLTTAGYDTMLFPENRWMAVVVGNHTSEMLSQREELTKRMVERIVKDATNWDNKKTNV